MDGYHNDNYAVYLFVCLKEKYLYFTDVFVSVRIIFFIVPAYS